MIVGNMIGGHPSTPKTCIFQTESGQEIFAVLVDSEELLTATGDDIRLGKTAATNYGVIEGNKVIPTYHTNQGAQIIPNGGTYKISSLAALDAYDFTKIQAIICKYSTTLSKSVAANKVVIEDKVYNVDSTEPISTLVKDGANKVIDFGLVNNTGLPQVLRFFTYKEMG